ncbi:MAG: response regulator [Cytophagaceae bacterium]
MDKIKILLADDHSIVRDGIKSTLSHHKKFNVIGEASNGLEAVLAVDRLHPDIAIVDISMPEMSGIEAVRKITALGDSTRCLILSMHDKEEYVMEAIEAGAFGYLLKDTEKEEFVKALNSISIGEKYFSTAVSGILVNGYLHKLKKEPVSKVEEEESSLTKRERNILKRIVKGENNKDIAEELDISIRTIETHRWNIMKKLKVKNAVEMVRKAMEEKMV